MLFSVVQGVTLNSCNRFMVATNGSGIRVLGEVQVAISIGRDFEIQRFFLVSD